MRTHARQQTRLHPLTAARPCLAACAHMRSHAFLSTKSAIGLDAVARVLSLLAPGVLHVFSAAKYTRSHHIDRHDDRAYTPVCVCVRVCGPLRSRPRACTRWCVCGPVGAKAAQPPNK